MGRLRERVLPRRLGPDFSWLLSSVWVAQVGDGIALAAGPLLVAAQTSDPGLVAAAALLQRLPWLLFGLYAGVLADRLDRKRLVVLVDLARALVVGVLAVAILGGRISIWLILVTMFVHGTCETFSDTASPTILPMVVAKPDLGVANSRLMGSHILINQLAGPPIGAALYAAGTAVPFAAQALSTALAALLISRMRVPALPPRDAPSHLRRDIAQGFRWLWGHPALRTLALTILVFNVTWGAAWSVLVLLAQQRLGLGPVGFGLLTTASAVGGLASIAAYDWLERRVALADLMRACLVTETLVHLGLALTTVPAVALGLMVAFGAEAFVWGTLARTVRQRAVPDVLQGRVGSVYTLAIFGGLVAGQAVGGVLAQGWGIVAPFWFAFVGSAVLLALIWRQLGHIAHDPEPAPA